MLKKIILPSFLVFLASCGSEVKNVDVDLIAQEYCNCITEEGTSLSDKCMQIELEANKKLDGQQDKLDSLKIKMENCLQKNLDQSYQETLDNLNETNSVENKS